MVRTLARATPFVLAGLLLATPASAQIVQSIQFGVGGFFPKGIDSRVSGDVLVANLNQPVIQDAPFDEPVTASLAFDMDDFKGWTLFGEWNIAFSDRLELGIGASYYSQKVDSRYRDLEHGLRPQAPDIEQEIGLRVLPLTTVVRFMPFGGPSNFQPYFGGGMGILNYRYSEIGEFVDPVTFEIFPGHFTKTGTTVGPLVLAGLRMPIGGDIYALTFEGRYQWGSADSGGAANEFLGDKIDLGGGSISFGFLVRF